MSKNIQSLLALLLLSTSCSTSREGPFRSTLGQREVVVFRHHPGMMDTAPTPERMKAREKDVEVLQSEMQRLGLPISCEGSLGSSGYTYTLPVSDLNVWQVMVNRLISEHRLQFYTSWGLDKNGFGFVPP